MNSSGLIAVFALVLCLLSPNVTVEPNWMHCSPSRLFLLTPNRNVIPAVNPLLLLSYTDRCFYVTILYLMQYSSPAAPTTASEMITQLNQHLSEVTGTKVEH